MIAPDLLSLAQAAIPPFTKTWRGPGVYEGEDDITVDFEWSPGRVSFTRVVTPSAVPVRNVDPQPRALRPKSTG